jgi:virginiamycin B lyase
MQTIGEITEFPLSWPDAAKGSTHEITYDRARGGPLWISGPNHHHIARVTLDGHAEFFAMPPGSGPHGMTFDAAGRLWVTLEFAGQVVRIDEHGVIAETIDVRLHAEGAKEPINTHPHGLAIGQDGKTLWFTGKLSGTVGRINADRSVEHFPLLTAGSVPIYISAGPDGDMWCVELAGNQIASITPDGKVTEHPIPTANSRPIAVIPGPDRASMWFSEEAGDAIGRIDLRADPRVVIELRVPMTQRNVILAGLTFDRAGNLWTQSYVDSANPQPPGADCIIRIDRAVVTSTPGDLSRIPIAYYQVPSRNTTMHRMIQGPDGNIWFTELAQDKVGRLITGDETTGEER